jgi:hypothetical protein
MIVTELLCAIKAFARQAPPKLPRLLQKGVTFHGSRAEVRYHVLRGGRHEKVGIIDRLNKHDGGDALQRT